MVICGNVFWSFMYQPNFYDAFQNDVKQIQCKWIETLLVDVSNVSAIID